LSKKDNHFFKDVTLSHEALNLAEKNIGDILSYAIRHSDRHKALIISDFDSPLAITLAKAYQRCLPTATRIDFNEISPSEILSIFKTLAPSDLVVLIQSSSFRLKDFRIRVELFDQSLKVIEHPHLARMVGLQGIYYIESLAYDSSYFHTLGPTLKTLLDEAHYGVVESGGERLIFNSMFEPAKLNIGDYRTMKNIGGQFPIGEVFTEAKDLESVNGRVCIFAFGDTSFSVNTVERSITLVINQGRVTEVIHSTTEFDKVLENICADEGQVWLRELGFGMNRAFSKSRTVNDIGTYERMCGVHLSLGAKHTVFKKANFKRKETWHHVDVFVDTEVVYLNEKIVYKNGTWQV